MKTYLVEAYDSNVNFDKSSTVVALTPLVCYQLDNAGVEYSIIEDYYEETKLAAGVDEYYKSQLQWIDGLDKFLQGNITKVKELDLKLGTLYYYYLKTMVLDALYIRGYALHKLFEAIKPSSIIYISPPPKEIPLDFTLQYYDKSYYSQLIPLLCNERNIPLNSITIEPKEKDDRKSGGARGLREILFRLGTGLYQNTTLRKLYFNYHYLSRRPFSKTKNRNGLNIFMFKLAHIGMDFVIEAIKRGHNVYQLSGSSILEYSSFFIRKHLDLPTEHGNNDIWAKVAHLLEGHDFSRQINRMYGRDISPIILPKLEYFVAQVCPEIIAYFKAFVDFYQQNKIDFVVTSHEVPPIEYAALATANHDKHIKTIRISHGDDAHTVEFWRILELSNSDILITSNNEAKAYFNSLRQASNMPTTLYSSPHRLLDMRQISHRRANNRTNIKPNRIIYLPTLMMWDTRRMDGASYPDTWYYQFQKSLAEYLATKSEYIFVWKGLPQSEAIYNPIFDFIRDNNFSNIEIATGPFAHYLPSAAKVICDYPSTGFYESITASIPTLCLYHQALIVRKSARDYFGNLLKPFADTTEAAKYIDEFLNSDPKQYQMTLDVEDNQILGTLEEASRKA